MTLFVSSLAMNGVDKKNLSSSQFSDVGLELEFTLAKTNLNIKVQFNGALGLGALRWKSSLKKSALNTGFEVSP